MSFRTFWTRDWTIFSYQLDFKTFYLYLSNIQAFAYFDPVALYSEQHMFISNIFNKVYVEIEMLMLNRMLKESKPFFLLLYVLQILELILLSHTFTVLYAIFLRYLKFSAICLITLRRMTCTTPSMQHLKKMRLLDEYVHLCLFYIILRYF